jgi:hypothetical protein
MARPCGRCPTKDRRRLLELRPPDDMRALTDADVPEVLAWPFTEKDGTRGRLVLANNGLGIDSWNLHHLRRFADSVRAMNLDPGTLVGGSAFIFSDMLEDMTRDGPRASLAAAVGSILVVLPYRGIRSLRVRDRSSAGHSARSPWWPSRRRLVEDQLSRFCGPAHHHRHWHRLLCQHRNASSATMATGVMPWPPQRVPSSFAPIRPPWAMGRCYFRKTAAFGPLDSPPWSVKSRAWSSPSWSHPRSWRCGDVIVPKICRTKGQSSS